MRLASRNGGLSLALGCRNKGNVVKKLQSLVLLTAALCFSSSGSAEVSQSAPSSFTLTQRIIVIEDLPASFQGLLHPGRWWSKDHTWSGNSSNLSLDPHAGGCWCERWNGGEVEHARVLFIKKDSMLRLQGAFGPMQSMAVNGILEFQLTPGKDGTQIDLTYRVTGADASKLDAIAPMADQMFKEQMALLKAMLDAQGQASR